MVHILCWECARIESDAKAPLSLFSFAVGIHKRICWILDWNLLYLFQRERGLLKIFRVDSDVVTPSLEIAHSGCECHITLMCLICRLMGSLWRNRTRYDSQPEGAVSRPGRYLWKIGLPLTPVAPRQIIPSLFFPHFADRAPLEPSSILSPLGPFTYEVCGRGS